MYVLYGTSANIVNVSPGIMQPSKASYAARVDLIGLKMYQEKLSSDQSELKNI